MDACPGCARQLPSTDFPFCPWCGQPLADEPAAGQRKTVTVLFADLVDSTVLGSSVDPEVLRGVLTQYWDGARRIVEAHGGTVEKFIGDAVVGVFGIPAVHEDDALRAVRAAEEVVADVAELSRRSQQQLGVRLEVRVGVNTGEVFTGDGAQTLMSGDTANVAARLQTAADPGQVLLGASTFALVRDAAVVEPLGPLTLKGKVDPVDAYRLTAVRAGGSIRPRRRFSGPMLGRERQLALGTSLFATVREGSTSALLTVIGEPGVGKSRLVDELLATVRDEATILVGGCLPYGDGITYAALSEVVSRLGERDVADVLQGAEHADRIMAGLRTLTGGPSATVDETVWAFRRLVELSAQRRPVVLVVDDVHWAEPALLELVRDLAAALRRLPVLIVVMARPELLASVPSWPSVLTTQATVVLPPLSDRHSHDLAASLLGPGVPDQLKQRVSDAAEGMPLFVEETVAMLVDEGALVADGSGAWTVVGDIDEVPVPATVRALLAARLDQLATAERDVVDAAAVVGRTFYRDAVLTLTGPEANVDGSIDGLVRADLVQPAASDLPGLEAFTFTHSLTAETAYASLPKNRRIALHLRTARWLRDEIGDPLHDGITAFHLERAVGYQQELGVSDAATRAELGALLVQLTRRACALADAGTASRYAARAVLACPSLVEARLAQSVAAWLGGDAVAALDAVDHAQRLADEVGDRVGWWRGAVWRETLRGVIDPTADVHEMLDLADRAMVELQGDDAGLAEAHRLRSEAYNWLGRIRDSADEAMTALEHELRLPAGSRRVGDLVVAALLPMLFGDTTLAENELRLERLEAMVGDDAGSQRGLTDARLWMLACRGDVASALVEMQRQADLLLEQGAPLWAAEVLGSGMTWSCTWTGDLVAAVEILQRAAALKGEAGEVGMRATWLAEVSVLLARLGRFDEARAALAESRSITPGDDIASVLEQAATEGLLAAAEGRVEDVTAWFATAERERRRGSEMLYSRAGLYLAWAQACDWLGDPEGRERALREALHLVEQKGFPAPIAYVRQLLDAASSDLTTT